MKPSSRLILTLALGSLLALAMSGTALAIHARPKSATPVTDRLVPAFDECTSASQSQFHGPPLELQSCPEHLPPFSRQTSDYLTTNAPDRWAPYNTPVDFSGVVVEKVSCLTPGTTTDTGQSPPCGEAGDQQDIKITVVTAGVRCYAEESPPPPQCAGGGALYSGKVMLVKKLKITDHYNTEATNPPGVDCSDTISCTGTVRNFWLTWGIQCSAGACNVVTSFDLAAPNLIQEGKRAVIAENPVEVQDAGANGDLAGGAGCPPVCYQDDAAKLYLEEGVFAP